MLTYINENPLAHGNEVFLKKCISEKKSPVLFSKLVSHVAYSYTSLSEEVKEFVGKSTLDRQKATVIQAKVKYFTSGHPVPEGPWGRCGG